MPPQAYALVTLFALSSVLLGWLATRLVARTLGVRASRVAYVLPILAAFGAFYLIGHRLGLSLGPEVSLFGFQVALLGDLALGFAAALVVAAMQAWVVRVRRGARQVQKT
jgi:fructose-specific phosphotransferase system IIC component